MTKKITPRQFEILQYVREQISSGMTPTLREIAAHFGFSSSHGALCHLKALERKGYIKRFGSKSRAIQLIGEESPMDVIETVWKEYTESGSLSRQTLKRVESFFSTEAT